MVHSRKLRSAVLIVLGALSISAYAAEEPIKKVAVPAGQLTTALKTLAEQSGVEFFYSTDQLEGLKTEGVQGEYTAEKAVLKLLEGTNLKLTRHESGALVITAADVAAAGANPTRNSIRLAQAGASSAGGEGEGRGNVPSSREGEGARSVDEGNAGKQTVEEMTPTVQGIPEILVTGSKILNMDIARTRDDTQPYVVFDRQTIEKAAASNVEDFLRTRLTMGNVSTTGLSASPIGNLSSISLRGLGQGETLILIDGHRTSSFGFSGSPLQPDLNGIPLSAIERIEILPTSASGIYGGSATGGVVNIILRRDFGGVETRLTYESPFSGSAENRRADLTGGFDLEGGRTHVMFAGSHADAKGGLVEERDFARQGREKILANNPAAFFGPTVTNPVLGATTNIRGTTGDLVLKQEYGGTPLNSRFTYVPVGYAGPSSDNGAALVANAGTYNFDLPDTAQRGGGKQSLTNAPTVSSITASVRRQFTSSLDAFLEVAASNNTGYFDTSNASASFTLLPTSQFNPFTQPVRVTTPAFGADGVLESSLYTRRAMAGFIARLPANWQGEFDYTWNRVRYESSLPGSLNTTTAGAAVSSGAIDVFRDSSEIADFSQFLLGPSLNPPSHARMNDAALRFSGPTLSLPGGPMTLSMLLEHRTEKFDDFRQILPLTATVVSQSFFPEREQAIKSAYLEARLPLFSEINALPAVELLELQLAGRYDDYSVKGANSIFSTTTPVLRATNDLSSVDPTIGLRWKPIADVMLRASYATGFIAPSVGQVVPNLPQLVPSRGLRDPLRGNEIVGDVMYTTGGNPDLRPEQSESWSAGLVFAPRFAERLRLSVDWTRITKRDNISTIVGTTQDELNNLIAFAPERVTRAAPAAGDSFRVGRITDVNGTFINIAQTEIEATDFAVDYTLATEGWGSLTFSGSATYMNKLDTRTVESAPLQENAGVFNNLKWKANATLGWERGAWSAAWTTRYFDSTFLNLAHTVDANQGEATIPSQTYHDLFASVRLGPDGGAGGGQSLSWLSGVEVQLGVRNVLNKKPPLDVQSTLGNFYSSWGDPRLATYTLTLSKSW